MSMYNMAFGHNPLVAFTLRLLELGPGDFGRFRDAWPEGDGEGGTRLRVMTRCGGGNREDYLEMFEEMRDREDYLFDEDERDWDSTYASIYFRYPGHDAVIAIAKKDGASDEDIEKICGHLTKIDALSPVSMSERFSEVLAGIRGSK